MLNDLASVYDHECRRFGEANGSRHILSLKIIYPRPLVNEEVGSSGAGARAARYLYQLPSRAMLFYPTGEPPMKHMGSIIADYVIS